MLSSELNFFRSVRAETQRLADNVSDEQARFVPQPGKWSIGEVLDHLLLAESLYRERFEKLIHLSKAGKEPVIVSSFTEIDTSILFIPKAALPYLEVPFKVMNALLPSAIRELLMRKALLPAQTPEIARPRAERNITDMRRELTASLQATDDLFAANHDLGYGAMRLSHPLIGNNAALQIIRIMALHEQRHQQQIRRIQHAPAFPKSV